MNAPRLLPFAALLLAACSVFVPGEAEERDRAKDLGARYAKPFAEREAVPLGADADLATWIAHAEAHHGGLEAAWHEWLAAIEQVPQAATQDTTAMLGVEHTFDGGAAIDRTGLMAMTDTMANFVFPGRLRDRGSAALAAARERGEAFVRARFRLQADVAERVLDLALRDRELELQDRTAALLDVTIASIAARSQVETGAARERLLAEAARTRLEVARRDARASRPALVHALSAIAGADPSTLPDARPSLPTARPLDDAERAAVRAALSHAPQVAEAKARHEAALAERTAAEWDRVPQFQLRSSLMGDGALLLQPAATLPFLREPAIAARLRQADARVHAAEALLRQDARDAVAEALVREAEADAAAARLDVLQSGLLPRLVAAAELARRSFGTGTGAIDAAIESEVAVLEVEAEVERARRDLCVARARLFAAAGIAAAETAAVTAESLPPAEGTPTAR